jgi:hypothetical protein
MLNAVQQGQKQSGSKFGFLQCRSDAQKWTADPFDTKDARNLMVNTAIMVNGQFRSIPSITLQVTFAGLMQRTYEMSVCEAEDADFEKQFSTYTSLARAYEEEQCFRYRLFLTTHHLEEQFTKEDEEANK